MKMQILKIVVENQKLNAAEIIKLIQATFPNEPLDFLKGCIHSLKNDGYLSVTVADGKIIYIGVNPSAYVALRESTNTKPASVVTNPVVNIRNMHGQVISGGTVGDYYNFDSPVTFEDSMTDCLKNILPEVDSQTKASPIERQKIVELLNQILVCLEKSEKPPQNLLTKLDAFLQKHSWLSAPIASVALQHLAKLLN